MCSSDLAVEQAAKAVAELELQLQKMNTLHDQQAQRQRKALAEQEQRGIDDLAIMRFGAKALY